jgi:DNA polymerase III subunit chi
MTRVSFYYNVADRQAFLPRLLQQALKKQAQVLVYCPDRSSAEALDEYLWLYEPSSFLPHVLADDALAERTPIVLSWPDGPEPHYKVWLNWSDQRPSSFSRCEQLIEIAGMLDPQRQSARERFRFYKERGYEMIQYDMASKS